MPKLRHIGTPGLTTRVHLLLYMCCVIWAACDTDRIVSSEPSNRAMDDALGIDRIDGDTSIVHVGVRVHTDKSRLQLRQLVAMLNEINHIWRSQADICFSMQITSSPAYLLDKTFDIWFLSQLPENADSGFLAMDPESATVVGAYINDHQIWALENHRFGSQVMAHELGHALTLGHYMGPGADTSLMKESVSQGFRLHDGEIRRARAVAKRRELRDVDQNECESPTLF